MVWCAWVFRIHHNFLFFLYALLVSCVFLGISTAFILFLPFSFILLHLSDWPTYWNRDTVWKWSENMPRMYPLVYWYNSFSFSSVVWLKIVIEYFGVSMVLRMHISNCLFFFEKTLYKWSLNLSCGIEVVRLKKRNEIKKFSNEFFCCDCFTWTFLWNFFSFSDDAHLRLDEISLSWPDSEMQTNVKFNIKYAVNLTWYIPKKGNN